VSLVSEPLQLTIVYEDAGDGWVLARDEARDNVIDALRERPRVSARRRACRTRRTASRSSSRSRREAARREGAPGLARSLADYWAG
jgi:hypothetical protein